jgi:hypothetical protein
MHLCGNAFIVENISWAVEALPEFLICNPSWLLVRRILITAICYLKIPPFNRIQSLKYSSNMRDTAVEFC